MIDSHELYIEQSIYQNIDQVVDVAARGFRFEEQAIMFDFNTETFGIRMQVEEDLNIKGIRRFADYAVPRWYDIRLQPPEFEQTPYMNILRAIFHFNQGDCEIVPSTNVINYKKCQMDIDRNIYFVKISCASVEEARKRAIVLAYLTYDMARHLFVKFSSANMLEDPYIFQNIYDCHEMFELEIEEEDIDVKHMLDKQAK